MAGSTSGTEEAAKSSSKKSIHSPITTKTNSPSTPKKVSNLLSYKIRLLDSYQKPLKIFISKNDDGQALFDKVCHELGGIIERDYFGLRYVDKNNQKQWLDLGRNVKKQMTGAHSAALSFRVKHYPGNPIVDFHQEISQYLLYLQIRRDLVQGRLLCPLNELYIIGALILQSEYGDAPEDEDSGELNGNVSDEDYKACFKNLKIVFNQTEKIETEIIARHKTYRGLTARDAEIEVIKRASMLPTYGVDPFPVKIITKEKTSKKADATSYKVEVTGDAANKSVSAANQSDAQSNKSAPTNLSGSVYLGLRHLGLTTYVGLQPSENIEWESIERLACDGKDFIVYVKPTAESGHETASQPESSPNLLEEEMTTKASTAVTEVEQSLSTANEKLSKTRKSKSKEKKENSKKEKVHRKAKKSATSAKSTGKLVKPRVMIFRCDTKAAALALWKWTVDRQSFFTLKQASEAKTTKSTHGLFRRSHSYRFIGKSQMELKSIANSAESLPQPSFVRVSSLRRPKSHEGEFSHLSGRSTLPARIRAAENGSFPVSDPVKRPPILKTSEKLEATRTDETSAISRTEEQQSGVTSNGVLNMANDLRSSQGSEVNSPINTDPVTIVPVSVNPVVANPDNVSGSPQPMNVDEVRNRTNHIVKPVVCDSECLRAVDEIDHAIEMAQSSNGRKPKAYGTTVLPNGEVSSREIKPTSAVPTSIEASRITSATSESFSSRSSLIIAIEVAAMIGVVCFGVVIAALETHPRPGLQSGLWTDLAMQLRSQPIVASFNEYVYAPLRGIFIGRSQ